MITAWPPSERPAPRQAFFSNGCQSRRGQAADNFRAMRIKNMRAGFMVPVACGVLLAAGCSVRIGSDAVSKAKVEHEIASRLTATVGQRPKAVICPGDLKAERGTTMRCQLEAGDGSKIGLTITVTAVKGSDVKFNIKVDNK
jgi:hypothetical protein